MYLKHYKCILFTISIIPVCVLFITEYASDLDRWTRASASERPPFAKDGQSGTRELIMLMGKKFEFDEIPPGKKNELDVEELLREKKDKLDVEEFLREKNNKLDVDLLPGKKEFGDEILTEVLETESIRRKLNQTIVNIEEDVFTMNVKLILKSMSIVPLHENRLVHKIQRAQRDTGYKCVIRIAKYCAKRCDHYIKQGDDINGNHFNFEWKMFHCDFAQPCQVETRFVGNLTSEIMESSDVIFFIASLHEGLQLMRLIASRPPGQLWTLYSRECPYHDAEYAPTGLTGNPFNLTMTYSRHADIYFPYCTLQKKQVHPPPLPKKAKLIAWMASNCHLLSWRRGDFVKELQKHLAVDTYGRCGSLGSLSAKQAGQVLPKYKFYLALESSECRDYITEKLWRTCLLRGIVPIVYGAEREDYEQTLPKNSFIYIEDYSNMSAFVDYIHTLDSDNAQYKKYFDWRREEQVTCLQARRMSMLSPEVNMWYLLRKLIHLYIHPETSWQRKTPNFASWWRRQCPDLTIEKNVLGFNVHQARQQKKKH